MLLLNQIREDSKKSPMESLKSLHWIRCRYARNDSASYLMRLHTLSHEVVEMFIHNHADLNAEIDEVADAVAARRSWIPLAKADLANLERAIVRHEGEKVHTLCLSLKNEGAGIGSHLLAPLVADVERFYDASDTKGALELALEIEDRLQRASISIDHHLLRFSHAAAAYERAQSGGSHQVHRLYSADIHRMAQRFGGNVDVAYAFVRERAIPELRTRFLDLRSAMTRGARSEVAEHCERIREISTTIGARRVLAEVNLIERSFDRGQSHYAVAFYRDALTELQAVIGWTTERRAGLPETTTPTR